MTNEKLIYKLRCVDAQLRKRADFYKGRGFVEMAEAVAEAIKRLKIHDRPPTVEEVGNDDWCLYKEGGDWTEETGKYIRENWWDGERWMYLPKESK